MRRLRAFFAGSTPAMLTGAFFVLAASRLGDANGTRVGLLLVGALYGLAVLGLIRLFRIAPWGSWFAGLACGPLPAALLMTRAAGQGDRQGVILLTALLGLLIGGIEHARRDADEG